MSSTLSRALFQRTQVRAGMSVSSRPSSSQSLTISTSRTTSSLLSSRALSRAVTYTSSRSQTQTQTQTQTQRRGTEERQLTRYEPKRLQLFMKMHCAYTTALIRALPQYPPTTTYRQMSYKEYCQQQMRARKMSSSSTAPPLASDSFLNGSNTYYVDEMYRQWLADPASVHKSWDVYFQSGQYQAPPKYVGDYAGSAGDRAARTTSAPASSGATTPSRAVDLTSLSDTIKVIQMIRAFQVRGHYMANLDPLGIANIRRGFVNPQELELSHYGFTEADLSRKVHVGLSNMKGFLGSDAPEMTLREVYSRLKEAYSGSIGVEYMHIPDVEKCNWIREKFETRNKAEFPKDKKGTILEQLTWADHFERILAKKFATAKRFGLEGGESTIPGMKALIARCAELGAEACVMGMPHRGRLNVLTNILGKPFEQIFAEFVGAELPDEEDYTGDVKYHMGLSKVQSFNEKPVKLSLVANPSHLEAVNPVVAGKTRAKQFYTNDTDGDKVFSLVLHGDAAFAGQGVVYETLGFSDLPAYETGGTIHIVVNNQIGFTTDPTVARSSPYCTEVARSVKAPIFHVNGDDPEAVVRACEIAAEFRYKFKCDVVIDIVCYRRHGHNEIDEPSFTQPRMYKTIEKHPSTLDVYAKDLVDEGSFTKAEVDAVSKRTWEELEKKFESSKQYKPKPGEWLSGDWNTMKPTTAFVPLKPTGVKLDTLKRVGKVISSFPSDFHIHSRLKGVYDAKKQMIETGNDLDWATAEALAFGTLLLEGHHVRLSGQDVERGTFSHRHAVIHDQTNHTKSPYTHLHHVDPKQAPFSVSNSHLSEYGVLGFEFGYSLENPNSLVLWEAQFGDFANGAQVIIDQFISSGEAKWRRQSGLIMLLPHGYEGQGPEHSSARLERYLQGSHENPEEYPEYGPDKVDQTQRNNWQVVNCTTPANYFHVLRRQLHRHFRKPLIVMSPKSLLRHRLARSTLAEMSEGTSFKTLIPETSSGLVKDDQVKRLILCTGKVYYDLVQHREAKGIKDVAIARVEQIAPFPFDKVGEQIARYKNAEVVWVQEEPMNMGAWTYVSPRIETAAKKKTRARYIGREPAASTATGHAKTHDREQAELVAEAFLPRKP